MFSVATIRFSDDGVTFGPTSSFTPDTTLFGDMAGGGTLYAGPGSPFTPTAEQSANGARLIPIPVSDTGRFVRLQVADQAWVMMGEVMFGGVSVTPQPVLITTQPQSQTANAGNPVSLTVTAEGTAPVSYQWRKDGVDLSDGGNISGAATPVLTLNQVQSTDAGSYDVVVSNAAGSVVSATAQLTVYPPETSGCFVAAPDSVVRRAGHTATLLADGRLLITGGSDSTFAALASAEIYDPANDTFRLTGAMATPRWLHAAALLPDGRVLVLGGVGLNSAEIYNPATGAFTPTGSMSVAGDGQTATPPANGKVLVTGGWSGGPSPNAQLFDPATSTFTPTGSMSVGRYNHRAVLLQDGRVLVAGGYGGVVSAELYDPATGAFGAAGNMSVARDQFTATRLADGRVLVVGGLGVPGAELFDPVARSFTATQNPISQHYMHTATLLPGGTVLITGYAGAYGTANAELYLDTPGTFVNPGRMGTDRFLQTATLLHDGRVLIVGGNNRNAGNEYFIPTTVSQPLVITLLGSNPLTVECHGSFADPGATANDACAGSFAASVAGSVDTSTPGTYTLTYTASDPSGNAALPVTRTVNVADTTPPVPNVASLPPVTGECSGTVTPPTATDACDGAITGTTSDPLTYAAQGTYTVHWTHTDSRGNKSIQTQMVTVQDTTPPFITCPADKAVAADPLVCSATVSGIAPDTAGDNCSVYTIAYTLTGATTGSGAHDASGRTFNLGTTTVTYTITDVAGLTASCSFTVTVVNPNPVVTLTGPASGSLYAINTPVNFTATFTDAGGGTHTGTWMFDSISQAATMVEPSDATPGSATTTYTFTAAGVYTVRLTINDNCGASSTADQIGGMNLLMVVYDPSAGFVTGGGWINSPAGAYVADPSLTGKANFGFVSKYQKGANVPTGNTEFQFKAGNLNFLSTAYQWLVVSGPKAQYKGDGTINGTGTYGFLLAVTDGQLSGGGDADKFRIKIWDKATGAIVYDNVLGASDDIDAANPQAIAGGSVVIHK